MKRKKGKLLAVLLCLLMTFSTVAAFAEGTEEPPAAASATADTADTEAPAEAETPAPQTETADTVQFDAKAFYDKLLACENAEDTDALLNALTSEEEAAFEEYLNVPANKPAAEALVTHPQGLSQTPAGENQAGASYVPRTKNVTKAGPFMPPVSLLAQQVLKATPAYAALANLKQADLLALASEDPDNGIETGKTVKVDQDGKYVITIEAYTTGSVTSIEKTIPVDVVLVLDQSGSMADDFGGSSTGNNQERRQYALKQAVNNFIDKVAEEYTEDADHRISIVTFGSGAAVQTSWTFVDNTGKAALHTSINGLPDKPEGATRTDKGMAEAEKLMGSGYSYAGQNQPRQKVVIVFTDGEPTTHSDFSIDVANGAIASAYNLKDAGCTVYSVGIFTGANPAELYGSNEPIVSSTTAQEWATENGVWEDYTTTIRFSTTNDHTGLKTELENIASPSEGQIYEFTYYTGGWRETSHTQKFKYQNGEWYVLSESGNFTVGGTAGEVGYYWQGTNADIPAANRFMNYMSSNYLNARNLGLEDISSYSTFGYEITANYPPRNEKGDYYLSANSADGLNSIFQSIAEQISAPTVELGPETVITDAITPYFKAPENANDVKLYTANYLSNQQWANPVAAPANVTCTITGKELQVTGFDYTANFVSENPKPGTESDYGKKLIVEFTVTPESGFLGGNNVPTNGEGSGISLGEVGEKFPVPKVNVPIKEVTVEAKDKNVYLTGTLTDDQLKAGAVIKCGEVVLNDPNHPLEEWQTKFVNITDTIAVADPQTNGYVKDTTYTITATVAPKSDAEEGVPGEEATTQTGTSEAAKINVFKPEFTFKDSDVCYGGTAPENPADYNKNNYVSNPLVWKHGETLDTEIGVAMIGEKPVMGDNGLLKLEYTPQDGTIKDGKINSKKDIPVKVVVKIGEADVTRYCAFVHKCDVFMTCPYTADVDSSGDGIVEPFCLHVKTCQLTITKEGGKPGEPYVFTILRGNKKYTEATITFEEGAPEGSVTVYELPVGDYTVEEDGGWSWHYEVSYTGGTNTNSNSGNCVTLSCNGNDSGAVTCTNTPKSDHWLNAYCQAVNEYGKSVGNTGASFVNGLIGKGGGN